MAEAEPGAGDIPIVLNGKELVLQPSLGACIAISAMAGGLNVAQQRCQQLDFGTICDVIAAGLGLNPTQARALPEAVYKTGLIDLHAKCIDFIGVVANGGQPLPEVEEEQEPAGDPPEPA